jgi:DNA-binding transcriptional LysR family regulator
MAKTAPTSTAAPAPATAVSENVLYGRMVARLRLRHLRLLVALDECRALGVAAAEVGMSQPAATQMLKELESLFDVQLYERHSRGLRPTEAAQALAAEARWALGNMQQAARAMVASAQGREATLHVGAIAAAVSSLLAPRIATLQARLPHLRLSITEDSPDHVMAQLNAGVLHVALVRAPVGGAPEPFRFTPLCEDRLVIVASPRHPVARRRSLRLAELETYPWSMPVSNHPAGLAFEAVCREVGIAPQRSSIQSISTALLCELTNDARTLAAVPRSIIVGLLAQGSLVELPVRERVPLPPLGAMVMVSRVSSATRALLEVLGTPPAR